MIPYFLFLTYIDLEQNVTPLTKNCFAMKSGSQLPFCNRVCALQPPTRQEIDQLIAYYGNTPFRWFVADTDQAQIAALEQAGLKFVCSFPAMHVDLVTISEAQYTAGIAIKELKTSQEIAQWVNVICKSYKTDQPEFTKFINYLIEAAAPGIIKFYGGYYQGVLAAASMTIQHGDIYGVHWVGTLPEYRGKGLGFAISHKPLVDARAAGGTKAILFASDMGKPIYEKIGFTTYARCNVYGKDVQTI